MFPLISEVQASTQSAVAVQPSPISGLMPILMIVIIFYFLLFRPQQKRIKQHNDMVNAVKKGDNVITSGGVIGKVTKTQDDVIFLEIADKVTIQIMRHTISNIYDKKFNVAKSTETKKAPKAKKK